MSFETIQKLDRFSRVWNAVANQGRFSQTVSALQKRLPTDKWFEFWWRMTEFFANRFQQLHGIHPDRFAEALLDYCSTVGTIDSVVVKSHLIQDYQNSGARTLPNFLKSPDLKTSASAKPKNQAPRRQQLHLKTKQLNPIDTETPNQGLIPEVTSVSN